MDEKNELVNVAFQIILDAGDARLDVDKALKEAEKFNFDICQQYIEKAEESIKKAHQCQTKVVQKEANGQSYEYCLLFTHAQDTLMTIMTELRVAKQIIQLAKVVDNRLKEIEVRL